MLKFIVENVINENEDVKEIVYKLIEKNKNKNIIVEQGQRVEIMKKDKELFVGEENWERVVGWVIRDEFYKVGGFYQQKLYFKIQEKKLYLYDLKVLIE